MTCTVKRNIAYQGLVGKSKGNRKIGGPRLRCEYHVKISNKNGIGGCVLDSYGLRLGTNCGFFLSR
jgi:hypothetical protein